MKYELAKELVTCKPILRWAGGKTWFLKHLHELLPTNGFGKYHEPFLGGASVLLHLQPRAAFVSDTNQELIETYRQIQGNVEQVILCLSAFENTQECYYDIRAANYTSAHERAARFIYLNQTSFNGIYRVNLKGEYNVPFGYRKKDFFDPDNIRAVANVIHNYQFFSSDFGESLENIEKGDLVFLDPPYTVSHNHNGFIKYNAKLFDEKSQFRLAEFIDNVDARGAYYILTNAAHAWVKEVFHRKGRVIKKFSRASLIGGAKAERGQYEEFVFSNIPPN